jgi:hypothetical protein
VLTNRNFVSDESRVVRYDAHACSVYQKESEEYVKVRICGMCVYACPHGREKKNGA